MNVRIILEARKEWGSIKQGERMTIFNNIFDAMNGIAFYPINREQWKIIAYDQWTGREDCKKQRIYNNDIIEFDRKEWGGDDNIHLVSWDNQNSEWSWGGGSSSDMEWRTKIGNKHDNPELINGAI